VAEGVVVADLVHQSEARFEPEGHAVGDRAIEIGPRRISKWSQRARSCSVTGMKAPSGPARALSAWHPSPRHGPQGTLHMSWGRLHELYSQADVPALVHIEPMSWIEDIENPVVRG
jgi:hypothetical protein